VTHEGVDDRLQPLDLCVGLALGDLCIELAGLFEDERAERFNVIGQVRFHEHEAVNQSEKAPSTGNLRRNRAASAMHPAPVQTLQQSAELRGRQTHHAVLDARPLEAAGLQLLGHQAQARAVPPDQLDPVAALRPEHVDHARIGIAAVLGADQRGQRVRPLAEIHGRVATITRAPAPGPIIAWP
jgi:hypothetical protein